MTDIPDENYEQLFQDFPELRSHDILLEKEILAHFGLLFSAYALLETALQNCYILWQLNMALRGGKIRSQDEWTAHHEALDKKAVDATFGTLLRLTSDCPLLAEDIKNLHSLKKKRDYFVHHFFREESSSMLHNTSILRLINRMNTVRIDVKRAEASIDAIIARIIKIIYPNIDTDAMITSEVHKMMADALMNPRMTFGWEKEA